MIRSAFLAMALLASPALAFAQESNDLARIPEASVTDGASPAGGRLYLEVVGSGIDLRPGLPALGGSRDWNARASLNLTSRWDLSSSIQATFNDRLSLVARDGQEDGAVRNDLREAYVGWRPGSDQGVQVGRINLRNGVAMAYSPTDFFRAGAEVSQASADPTSAREGRLGVVMIHYQRFWPGGSFAVAWVPQLADRRGLLDGGADWGWDRTNGVERTLVTVNLALADLSPQASLLLAEDETRLGLSVSHLVGDSVVLYGEWAGGRRRDLIAEATRREPALAGTIPFQARGGRRFLNEASLGASWSNGEAKLTVNVEYQYNGGGLDGRDLDAYFQAARNQTPSAQLALVAVRAAAGARGEPFSRQQVFVMASRQDAGARGLTLGALATINAYDGSATGQTWLAYEPVAAWSFGAYLSFAAGRRAATEYGSVAPRLAATLQVVRYF
jgi:hypothetical protein